MESLLIGFGVFLLVIMAVCFFICFLFGKFLESIEGKGRDVVKKLLDRQ
jgi:hypothetical protein